MNDIITWIGVKQLRQVNRLRKLTITPRHDFERWAIRELIKTLTEDGTASIAKVVAVQAVTIHKVCVGRAGEGPAFTDLFHRVKIEKHWPLVVAFKIGLSWKRRGYDDDKMLWWFLSTFNYCDPYFLDNWKFMMMSSFYQTLWSLGSWAGLLHH